MKFRRLLVVLAVVGAAALSLVLVGGAAAKPPSDHWTITLDATPNPVDAGATLTFSGVLLNNGEQGVGNQEVAIVEFWDSECSGESHQFLSTVTSNAHEDKGQYSVGMTVNDDADGDYYVQAQATGHGEGKYAVSDCVVVTVNGSGDENGGGNDDGGDDETGGGGSLAPAKPWPPSGPDHYGYCSVQGNTLPDGTPLAPGTFLNLLGDQPLTDEHYTGATPAFWIEGVGITCDLSPAQAAIAATTTAKVNHVGKPDTEDGPLFYTFIPKA